MYFPVDENSGFRLKNFPNVEFVNPIEYAKKKFVEGMFELSKNMILNDKRTKDFPPDIMQQVLVKKLLKDWEENYSKIISYKFPDNFFDLLICMNKKKQEKILKNFHFDTDILEALIYKAWNDYGFSFSFYKYERIPSQFQNRKMPAAAVLEEDGTITKSGYTDMTDGEIKTVIEQRNNVFAKFLDNGKIWHCFLYTYDSLTGKEVKQTPHIHYISSAFGTQVTRERVLTEIKKGKYRLPPMLHLTYSRYLHRQEK